MNCPSCQVENPESANFCCRCGHPIRLTCPQCEKPNPPGSSFCNQCGHQLEEKKEKPLPLTEAERKIVTVLFCDLSGYTAMTEKLDPEEVKEIMGRIFGEIAQVVAQYEGWIHQLIGDQAMILFGVPRTHEDDPFRALKAAKEIHDRVEALSPQFEGKIGRPLCMHSGIHTGLVVIGELDLEKKMYGSVTGDTINLAARLSDLARSGEIWVGPETYRRTQGAFTFESLGSTPIQGKAEPIPIYKVLSAKERPTTTFRLSGLRADLIGRKVELAQLEEAALRLQKGKGTLLSLCGEPGTGKSRLVQEFRDTLDLERVQWLEGHAYAYSQNIPYFPLIDLLSRAWQIEEGDPPETVREKVESRIELLLGKKAEIAPYLGSLYALRYPQLEGVSPELWKSRLLNAAQTLFFAEVQRAPTVVCLEDLHWADPSSLDLLRFLLSSFRYPALFLLVYRLPFSLFTSHEHSAMGRSYQEIRLQDLSPSEAQDMMESLLQSKTIPVELRRFVQEQVEGNPFYLEEVINSLIESGTLTRADGTWKLACPLSEADIPPTIQGVISARIDRLEPGAKRVLQEASVIGRVFPCDILERITRHPVRLDTCLNHLERLDLIRTRALQPEMEYLFKHALTQEVVYRGLVRRERQEVHERIGAVMEQVYQGRLSEFHETLAFHYKHGLSIAKAIDYLAKSAEKSMKKYAVEESHRYFREAYDLLMEQPVGTKEANELLIDLLNRWSLAFQYRGDSQGWTDLLTRHKPLAMALGDRSKLGMYYALLGSALYQTERIEEAYQYLCEALSLGEEMQDQRVIGYACSWLAWVCPELGFFQEAVCSGERAKEIALLTAEDQIFFLSLGALGLNYYYSGDRKKGYENGQDLLKYGREHENPRCQVLGHFSIGCSHLVAGDFASAKESMERAISMSMDPWYSQFPRLLLGLCLVLMNQFQEAKEALTKVLEHSHLFGSGIVGTPARSLLAIIMIAEGRLGEGMKRLEEIQQGYLLSKRRFVYAAAELQIGKIYSQMATGLQGDYPMIRNLGFLVRNFPFARRRAEEHLKSAVAAAEEIGAKSLAGMACLDLGLLYHATDKKEQARDSLTRARQHLEACGAEMFLKQVDSLMNSIEGIPR